MKKEGLGFLFRKIRSVLKENNIPHLVIGGIASGVIGKPRFTEVVDLLIFVSKAKIKILLKSLAAAGLAFDKKEAENTILARGVFRVLMGKYHADFVISAIESGRRALKKAIEIELWGEKVKFPSPEDLILFKLIAGRELDLIDAKEVFSRNRKRIDRKYLIASAQQICDETENMSVWKRLQKWCAQ